MASVLSSVSSLFSGIFFSLRSGQTALSSSSASTADKTTISDFIASAERDLTLLQTAVEDEKKAFASAAATQATAPTATVTMGALTFKDGCVSINTLPTGSNTDFRMAGDVLERIKLAPSIDLLTRLGAYAELYALQATFKLSDEALWMLLYKAPAHVRDQLAISSSHMSKAEWLASFTRHLDATPVDKFGIFSESRGTDPLQAALTGSQFRRASGPPLPSRNTLCQCDFSGPSTWKQTL
jgi:hypothetical protein